MTLFLQSRFSKIILGRLFIDFGFFTAWLFIKLICVDCDYVWAYFFYLRLIKIIPILIYLILRIY